MQSKFNTITKLYTPAELGKFLNVSKTTVYRLIESNRIPFYKIKGSIRFSHEDVLNYLNNNRIEPIN